MAEELNLTWDELLELLLSMPEDCVVTVDLGFLEDAEDG